MHPLSILVFQTSSTRMHAFLSIFVAIVVRFTIVMHRRRLCAFRRFARVLASYYRLQPSVVQLASFG